MLLGQCVEAVACVIRSMCRGSGTCYLASVLLIFFITLFNIYFMLITYHLEDLSSLNIKKDEKG